MSVKNKEVDALFSKWDKVDSPGCILAVIKDGKMIYERGYGMANLEHHVPITSESVFRIGSISKQFTAMCVAILAEKKLLSLDDTVRKYIPELPDYAETITIRNMLHHTSGIRSYTDLFSLSLFTMDIKYFDNVGSDEVLEMIARQENPEFKSGELWDYSNSNYFLLGLIVERVSGKTLREYAHENIFKPLGMNNTHYHDDCKMIVNNRAYGYTNKEDGSFEISMSNNEVVGDGTVFTTVNDLLHWDRNFYKNKLLRSKKLAKSFESVGSLNDGTPHTYAFGLMVMKYKGLQMICHGGAWAGFNAFIARFPDHEFTVMVLANLNSRNSQSLALSVVDMYLKEHMDEESIKQTDEASEIFEVPEKQLDELVGMYLTSVESLIEISRVDSRLLAVVVGMKESATTYIPISKTEFNPVDGMLTGKLVTKVNEKKQTELMYHRPDGSVSTWAPFPKTIPTDEIAEYVGHYYSKELDALFELKNVGDSKLVCKGPHRWSDELELHKLADDELLLLGIRIKFKRNKKKQVIGFDLLLKSHSTGIRFRKKKAI